ncbi:MAG: patatin-like phospholipase family protein [Betaproteobacteria bacterium]|nr:patatin-like phospholipase family protein [Betaproteobacteria bacterium]
MTAPEAPAAAGRKRVAMVIGSGSVKCAAALGVQNALTRAGIGIDLVVGCSAGAMFASLIAAGFDAARARELTHRLWTREITSRRDTRGLLAALMPKWFRFNSEFGMRDDKLVMERLRETFGKMSFESMQIPLYITATDFATGEQVVFSRGSLTDAIRASIAIPFIFKPWRVDGRLCVDGFLSDPLPVGVAVKEGAGIILAVGFESPYQRRITSPARFAFQLSSIMTNNLFKSAFAFHQLAHHDEVIPIVPQFDQHVGLFETAKLAYVIEEGEKAAEEQIPYLRRLLDLGPGPATDAATPGSP